MEEYPTKRKTFKIIKKLGTNISRPLEGNPVLGKPVRVVVIRKPEVGGKMDTNISRPPEDIEEYPAKGKTVPLIRKSEVGGKMETNISRPPEDIDNTDLYVGRKFSCYDDFQTVLKARSSLLNEKWRIRQNTTVGKRNMVVDNPKLHLPDRLKYYSVGFRCIHEGEKLPTTGTGQRPRQ